MKIPEGYQQVMPYLILNNASEFLEFVKKVFNAKEKLKHLNDDQSIMHAEVVIGDSVIMIGNSGDQWQVNTAGLFIYVENPDETFKKALDNGATVVMELEDKDYGRTGGVKDISGNIWWITSPPK